MGLLLFSCQVMSNSLANPWTVAYQSPLSMGSPRQEYWSGLPFPPPGDLPDPRIKFTSPPLTGRFFTTEPPGKPSHWFYLQNIPRIQPLLPTLALGFCSFPFPVSGLPPSPLFVFIPCNSCRNLFKTRSDHYLLCSTLPIFHSKEKPTSLKARPLSDLLSHLLTSLPLLQPPWLPAISQACQEHSFLRVFAPAVPST